MLLHVYCNSWEINSKGEDSNNFVLADTTITMTRQQLNYSVDADHYVSRPLAIAAAATT